MLLAANLPEFLWAEAVDATTHIHNRLLDSQRPLRIAYEQIIGVKSSVHHIRTFGCKAYSQIPKEKQTVWGAKGKPHVLVGYENNSKKYCLYADGQIILARNVSFNENITEAEQSLSDHEVDDEDLQCSYPRSS